MRGRVVDGPVENRPIDDVVVPGGISETEVEELSPVKLLRQALSGVLKHWNETGMSSLGSLRAIDEQLHHRSEIRIEEVSGLHYHFKKIPTMSVA